MTPWREYGRYGSIGLELVLSVVVGYLGGRWLDVHLGAHGWLTLVGLILGAVAGFRSIVQAAHRMEREFGADAPIKEEAPPPAPPPHDTHHLGPHDDDERPSS